MVRLLTGTLPDIHKIPCLQLLSLVRYPGSNTEAQWETFETLLKAFIQALLVLVEFSCNNLNILQNRKVLLLVEDHMM